MTEFKYQRIVQAAIEYPWAILPAKLAIIQDLLVFRANGGHLTEDEIRERLGEIEPPDLESRYMARMDDRKRYPMVNDAAILPILGTIIPRADMFAESSGAVSIERFQNRFRAALDDKDVNRIIIDIDSPGGQVFGVEELSSEIFQARGQKPITAIANNLAASAAYWIGSAADELVITPSGEVGSIGVFAVHQDLSQMLEKLGVKMSLISAGKYKTESNPFQPLSEEAQMAIKERVDDYYNMFITAVARNRSVSAQKAKDEFGEGRIVGSQMAVRSGMADAIGTLDQVIMNTLPSSKEFPDGRQAHSFSITSDIPADLSGVNIGQSDTHTGTSFGSGQPYLVMQPIIIEKESNMPNQVEQVPDTTPQPEPPQALSLPDGTRVTLAEFQLMQAELEQVKADRKQAKIAIVTEAAKARGVGPAVYEFVAKLMAECELEAEPVLVFEDQKYNLFGALNRLLEIVPGKEMAQLTTPEKGKQPPAGPEPQAEMTLEEAEEQARQKRKELGLRSRTNVAPELA